MVISLRFLLLSLVLPLAGCGFHLRGSGGEFEALPPVYVQGGDPAAAELRQFLRTGGTEVVDAVSRAQLIVTVARVERERRILSVGTRGRVQEYELIYALTWHGDDRAGRRVLDEQTVTQTRNFSFDETDIIAKSNEEDFLFRDMQRAAVMQIMRRLQVADFSAIAPDGAPIPDDAEPGMLPPDSGPTGETITAPPTSPEAVP